MKSKTSLTQILLPEELIEEILLRLPVRCVVRLKCVCKSWLSLICNPRFAKSHFYLAAAPAHQLLLKSSEDSNSEVEFVDIEDDSVKVAYKAQKDGPSTDVGGSCRGFVLLTTASYEYFIIWNPVTGIQNRFDNVSPPKHPYLCGFGYDSSTDDYVVVTPTFLSNRTSMEVHCFSLRTNSWSCINSAFTNMNGVHLMGELRHGSFLNGAIHWLVYSGEYCPKIIAFDVTEKSLSEIPLPRELNLSQVYRLRIMGECLCICSVWTARTQMWVMKEYKVQSSWAKTFVFSFYNGFGRSVPLYFFKNGEILAHDHRNMLLRLNEKGELPLFNSDRRYLLYYGVHRASLLSLPGATLRTKRRLTKRR